MKNLFIYLIIFYIMNKKVFSNVKRCVINGSSKIEKYLEFMERMPALLLDYITHCNMPSRIKQVIAMHLACGDDVSCLVKMKERIRHGYQIIGAASGAELWVMPIHVEGKSLLVIHNVDTDKMYIQDTPLQFAEIA